MASSTCLRTSEAKKSKSRLEGTDRAHTENLLIDHHRDCELLLSPILENEKRTEVVVETERPRRW
jgi:hypothetical protein